MEAVKSSVGLVMGRGSLETFERGTGDTFGVHFGRKAHKR